MSLGEQDLLQQLIRISSVNPALAGDSPQRGGEAELTDFLVEFLQKNRWPCLRQTVHPGRDNLIAVLRGSTSQANSEVVLWEVHQDTVGVTGMRIDPFSVSQNRRNDQEDETRREDAMQHFPAPPRDQ